jgi:5S rRNA maturation endonuclease (ribonuclease M5)
MAREKSAGFVNVDELMPQLSLEQVVAFYGVLLPDCARIGSETRMKCFLLCGKAQETGDRALAIQTEHPAKQWKCHQYGCGRGGNLVSLCDLLKPGANGNGRPRGERFKEIAADLRRMVSGVFDAPRPAEATLTVAAPPPAPKISVPLVRSENERARGLCDLDRKFIVDVADMPPAASAYFRRRPFLTPEHCRKWRMGYLPRDTGGSDKTGGTMRGSVVYPILSETGEVLTWFGRDPEFETKHQTWLASGKQSHEPEKFHFVKGFHRGLELFGQNGQERLRQRGYRERLGELGLIVVEGPNDVMALDAIGVPSVGLCSNTVTHAQVAKIVRWANDLADGQVTLMLDCDEEGENGMKQALWQLAQQCRVRLLWSREMYGGKFRGRQPESVEADEWGKISAWITRTRPTA